MRTETVTQQELDLSVFETDFDPHGRSRQVKRVIRLIQENQPDPLNQPQFSKSEFRSHVLSTENQASLLGYAGFLIHRMKRGEIGAVTFQKNLTEAHVFCLWLKETSAKTASEAVVREWWEFQLNRFENRQIGWGTLEKLANCLIAFFQFLEGLPPKKRSERLVGIQLPKHPKSKLQETMPSQTEIKQLIESVYVEGKRYSIRDQAIMALANDTGARISEILSIRNKHIREEENYLVVSFPESKTKPRTVISFLAKKYLESWAKVSPNRKAGPEAFFFCQKNGKSCTYAVILKALKKALKKNGVPWKKNRALHYFRNVCSSRFYNWPYNLKHAWFGWSYSDHENAYTQINHTQFVEIYFETLRKENNPFLTEELPFWTETKLDQAIIEKLLEHDEFRTMVRRLVRQAGGAKDGEMTVE
jgi:site-specific recombinase XerC